MTNINTDTQLQQNLNQNLNLISGYLQDSSGLVHEFVRYQFSAEIRFVVLFSSSCSDFLTASVSFRT